MKDKTFNPSVDGDLKEIALNLLQNAIYECQNGILYFYNKQSDVKIYVPYCFHNVISNGEDFYFQGFQVKIGYEKSIVIFNEKNNDFSKVFKYDI